MQSATGSGEAVARIAVNAGRAQVDWRVFILVRQTRAIRAQPGRRRSGQAGYGTGAAQVERVARKEKRSSGGCVWTTGSGTCGNGRKGSSGAAGVVWAERTGAEPLDSRNIRSAGFNSVFHCG